MLIQYLIGIEALFEYTVRRQDGGAVRKFTPVQNGPSQISFNKQKQRHKETTANK